MMYIFYDISRIVSVIRILLTIPGTQNPRMCILKGLTIYVSRYKMIYRHQNIHLQSYCEILLLLNVES